MGEIVFSTDESNLLSSYASKLHSFGQVSDWRMPVCGYNHLYSQISLIVLRMLRLCYWMKNVSPGITTIIYLSLHFWVTLVKLVHFQKNNY